MRRERSVFALTSAIGCAIVIFLSIGVAGMFSLFIPEYMAEYGYSKMEMSYVAMVATVSGFLFSLIGSKLINALGPKKSLLVGSLASAVFLCLIGSVDNLVALGLVSLAQGAVLGLGAHGQLRWCDCRVVRGQDGLRYRRGFWLLLIWVHGFQLAGRAAAQGHELSHDPGFFRHRCRRDRRFGQSAPDPDARRPAAGSGERRGRRADGGGWRGLS